jgi:acyl-CoA synthetase (NDP forming)
VFFSTLLEAGADRIRVDVTKSDRKAGVQVTVVDNGSGMTPRQLAEALTFGGSSRFGSRTSYGRFGMGLPSASFSLARRVEVKTWRGASLHAATLQVDYGAPHHSLDSGGGGRGDEATRRRAGRRQDRFVGPQTDIGGVSLTIGSTAEAVTALRDMQARLKAAGLAEHAERFLVQAMVDNGVEMVVGVVHDPAFGPLVMVGCGGSLVELIGDVNLRITPLTDIDVDEMLTSLRTYPLLTGFRGTPTVDGAALKDLLYRINYLVEHIPEIAEMDLNPVFVQQHGVVVADIRISVSPVSVR